MKNYEIMTIANISLGEDKAKQLFEKVESFITSNNGNITNSDYWGKRKFAYPIKHDEEGYYKVVTFEMDPAGLDPLKNKLNLEEGLVRYLVSAL